MAIAKSYVKRGARAACPPQGRRAACAPRFLTETGDFDMTLDLTEFLPNATIHVIQYREYLESQGVQMPPGLLCVKSGIPKRKRCQHV